MEDDLNRTLPPTGVLPIATLSAGQKISYITSVDNEALIKTGEILSLPSEENAEEWVEGLFEMRDEEDEESKEIKKFIFIQLHMKVFVLEYLGIKCF